MKLKLFFRGVVTALHSRLSHQKQASNWRRFFLFPMKGDPGYRRDLAKNIEFQVELIEEEFNEMLEEVNKLVQLVRLNGAAERRNIEAKLCAAAQKGSGTFAAKNFKLFTDGQPFPIAVDAVRGRLLKEMADVAFTLYQLSGLLDMDLSEALNRVYVSNMSKVGNDGYPVFNEKGKAQKTENYFPPDLSGLH